MTYTLDIPDALVEALTERVVARMREERRFLSKEALAEHLGVEPRTVKTLRAKGMPARRVGAVVLYDVAEVNDWIARHQDGC